MSRPPLPVVQGEVRILEPTMAVHNSRTFSLDDPAQRGHRAWIRDCRMERARSVCMKSGQAAPSADADYVYTIECLIGRIVTNLERHNCDSMSEADQLPT